MRSLILKLEVVAGSPVKDAITELVAVADRLQISTECIFNDVIVMALPGDSPDAIEESWHRAFASRDKCKFASDRSRK